jgi:hypothetical protein
MQFGFAVKERGRLMSAYEFRFMNAHGEMLLLYHTQCFGDDDARSKIGAAADVGYSRFEIWQDDRKVGCGKRRSSLH